MASMTLICLLLFSGTFLVDTSAQTSSPIMLNISTDTNPTTHSSPNTTTQTSPNTTTQTSPNTTTQTSPKTTTHTSSNTTTHTSTKTTTHTSTKTTTHTSSNTTTHAPSNTTTHAPSNTTTHAPSNTTTHAPSNTTTHAPSNTTTHAPSNTTTTNTTSHTTTHFIPTLPPTSGPPEIGSYTVKDGNVPCIIADMGLELQIDISPKGKTDIRYLNINPNYTKASGTCGKSNSSLHLQFPEGFINFIFIKESKIYYIEEVSVQLHVASTGQWNATTNNLKLLPTDVGYSVACKRTPDVKLGDDLKLVLAEVKLQAFDITDGKLGKEERCSYDRNFTAVIIAVVVIAIIIIAVAVYFIWHKRKSSGYQQI